MRAENLLLQSGGNPWLCGKAIKLVYADGVPENFRSLIQCFIRFTAVKYRVLESIWIDFENKQYFFDKNRKRISFQCRWSDVVDYRTANPRDNYPYFCFAAKQGYYSYNDMLRSLTEILFIYKAHILGIYSPDFTPNIEDVEDVLADFFSSEDYRRLNT